jgi:hypothetical protein
MNKYESNDPSKVSIVRTRYEHYHMKEGQSVVAYITVMKEYRYQLFRMGETITDSTHATTLLRNVLIGIVFHASGTQSSSHVSAVSLADMLQRLIIHNDKIPLSP